MSNEVQGMSYELRIACCVPSAFLKAGLRFTFRDLRFAIDNWTIEGTRSASEITNYESRFASRYDCNITTAANSS